MYKFSKVKTSEIAIWSIRCLPFKKRFSIEEYKELYRILAEQTKIFRKRPQYIIGNILLFAIVLYFFISGLLSRPTDWQNVGFAMLLLFTALCCENSVKEHLWEALLKLKQHPEDIDRI
jgi:hypothetical protein